MLFIGGTFSIAVYTKNNSIPNYFVVKNMTQLAGFHNTSVLFVMEDASDVYGSALGPMLHFAKENGYSIIQLQYADPFPTDDEIDSMRVRREPNDTV